ncbi:MAG: gluconolactonase [Sphingomonas bacterium]
MLSTLMPRFLLLASAAAIVAAAPAPSYKVARSIPVPDGGWDYAKVDTEAGKLYVARTDSVTVVNLKDDAVSSIGAIVRGHAVVPIAGTTLLLVSSGRDDSVRIFDITTGAEKAKFAVGGDPDAALYDGITKHAYVMNAKAGTVSIIDPVAATVVGTIMLKPGLEFAVGAGSTLYVNNEDENEIETADMVTGKAGAAIPLTGCTGPTGLGFDKQRNRLISACANGKAAVVDLATKQVSLLAIGLGPDAVIIDRPRGVALIPCGKDGTLSVIDIASPGAATVIATVPTEVGARTGAVDRRDGNVYLPTARFGPPATPGARPTMIPGSAHILVLSPK